MNKWVGYLLLAAFLVFLTSCGASSVDSGRTLSLQAMESGADTWTYNWTDNWTDNRADNRAEPSPSLRKQASAGKLTASQAAGSSGNFPPPVRLPMPGEAYEGGYADYRGGFAGGGITPAQGGRTPSLASVTIEVDSIQGASLRVQAIAESMGGFVERLASSGGSQLPRADLVIRVPQDQFAAAMDRIEALGSVQFRSLGSEDITEQHLDLTARLAAYQKEEQSLNSLMERAGSVSEVLSVERELARVRSNIERSQSQLDLLEGRLELATVHVSLFPAGSLYATGPSARLALEVPSVMEDLGKIRKYVNDRGGEVDEVYLASNGDMERAEVRFRVHDRDFERTVAFIGAQGTVTARELLETSSAREGNASESRRPSASFQVTYVAGSDGLGFWRPALVVLVVVILAVAGYYLARLAYQRGRRRGSFI